MEFHGPTEKETNRDMGNIRDLCKYPILDDPRDLERWEIGQIVQKILHDLINTQFSIIDQNKSGKTRQINKQKLLANYFDMHYIYNL